MRKGFRSGRLERKATSVNASFCRRQRTVRLFVYYSDSANPVLGSGGPRHIQRLEVELLGAADIVHGRRTRRLMACFSVSG